MVAPGAAGRDQAAVRTPDRRRPVLRRLPPRRHLLVRVEQRHFERRR
jgi:hypothetical protein